MIGDDASRWREEDNPSLWSIAKIRSDLTTCHNNAMAFIIWTKQCITTWITLNLLTKWQ